MALGELKNGIGPDAYAIYQQVLAAVVERDHPVGSLYISENSTSPAELYGGTWEQIKDSFILAAGDTYAAGSTGGSNTVPINKDNLPNIALDVYGIYQITETGNKIDTLTYRGQGAISGKWSKIAETDQIGKGIPLNILPPYYSMYIWRRVA